MTRRANKLPAPWWFAPLFVVSIVVYTFVVLWAYQ